MAEADRAQRMTCSTAVAFMVSLSNHEGVARLGRFMVRQAHHDAISPSLDRS
jgi:hypothetical protein